MVDDSSKAPLTPNTKSYQSRRRSVTPQKFEDHEDEIDNEGSTYTEMIEKALRALGGRGTGLEHSREFSSDQLIH